MRDGVSLDQRRTFIVAADEGSFPAAGDRCDERNPSSVKRSQIWRPSSASNCSIAWPPTGLDEPGPWASCGSSRGRKQMDVFKARAKAWQMARARAERRVDAVFPLGHLTDAVAAFQAKFPATPSDCMR